MKLPIARPGALSMALEKTSENILAVLQPICFLLCYIPLRCYAVRTKKSQAERAIHSTVADDVVKTMAPVTISSSARFAIAVTGQLFALALLNRCSSFLFFKVIRFT